MRHLMGRLFLVVVLSGIAVTPVMLQAIPCTCDFMMECTGVCECSGSGEVIICSCSECTPRMD